MMDVLKNTVKSASVIMIVLDGNQVILYSNTFTGAMTFNITILSIITLSIMTLSIMTFSITINKM
jgi:hypothetical protein